jgi:hypothetical protein
MRFAQAGALGDGRAVVGGYVVPQLAPPPSTLSRKGREESWANPDSGAAVGQPHGIRP